MKPSPIIPTFTLEPSASQYCRCLAPSILCTARVAHRFAWFAAVILVTFACAHASAQQMQSASIGDLKLRNGQVIRNCTIAYRTFGTLNAEKSNAVLFPTWFGGTSKDLAGLIGPGKLVDPAKFYVIATDAIGNGVSTSPSNSSAQPHMQFPKFSIRDIVEAQRIALTEKLGIAHLHAVMGISMGGMQTFQWLVSYPEFLSLAVSIMGSPRLTSYDLLLWKAEEHAIENDESWQHGEYTEPPDSMRTVAAIHALALQTPDYWVEHTPREKFDDVLKGIETKASPDTNNWLRQLQAMMGLDVSREFGGDMAKAAAAVRAKVLVVANTQDHMVNATPGLDFAKALGAQTMVLTDNCGHQSTMCNTRKIGEAVNSFLASQ